MKELTMPIKDQNKYKELEQLIKQLRTLSPFLSAKDKAEISQLETQLKHMRNLPDRFNQVFRDHGWIAYEEMNFDAAEKALQIADEKSIEAAEDYLEDYYNTTNEFDIWVRDFCRNPLIKPRRPLLLLALDDHKSGRYHASVPVVLAQIDGIVFDLYNKSFFESTAKKTGHLQATESIAGDPEGLPLLAILLSHNRNKTSEKSISLPYRHGILHGRDLGYANRRVSTKAFVTLLSLRNWIEKVQEGKQFEQPLSDFLDPDNMTWDDIKKAWKDFFDSLAEYAKKHRHDTE